MVIGQKRRLQILVGALAGLLIATNVHEHIYGAPERFWVSWTYWLPMAFFIFLILYVYRLRCRTCHAHQVKRGASMSDMRWPTDRCYSCNALMAGSEDGEEQDPGVAAPQLKISGNPEFWQEAKRRRNLFFYVWVGWLLAGFPLVAFYIWLLKPVSMMSAGIAALATWGALWLWTFFNLTRMRCLECGDKAFSHPFFLMRHARCLSCGVIHKSG